LLSAVSRALIASNSHEDWERGLRYARHSEDLLLQEKNAAEHASRPSSELRDRIDRDLSHALQDEAEATGKLGRPDDALALARRAFETFPNAGAAREAARWCERLNHPLDAAAALADAITVPDPRATAEERARDRARMGELYREGKGSDAGLGDMLLEAFDRNIALVHARQTRLRAGDPNAGIADPMDFTLAGVGGDKLSLATLKGKVVVLDFWATWCVPCRQEHPLLEQVRAKFAGNGDVVFLSIDTDEDRSAVPKFLQAAGWSDRVYFEDGLSRALNVMSIPSTIVVGRDGNVFSRMTGFVAGQFVDTLSARITDALR
jgi:thiol-disulfide isomerase/thioredoxin